MSVFGDKRTSRGEAPMVQGIDNIGMCTTDVERLIAFYQKLGFSEAHRNDRGVMMAASTVNLFIFATQLACSSIVRLRTSAGAPAWSVSGTRMVTTCTYCRGFRSRWQCRAPRPAILWDGVR